MVLFRKTNILRISKDRCWPIRKFTE